MRKKKERKSKKPKKTEPYPNPQRIKGALRRLMARSPIVREVLAKAVHPTEKGPRGGKRYICAKCKNTFGQREVSVDHRQPVVPVTKHLQDMDYNEIVQRLFCKKSNLQVLCKECHKAKTAEERKKRKYYNDRRKGKENTKKKSTKK